ncbi:MAG: MotA/TolQ/ExbB proton channel family protein [Solirubrobacterales bacterium]
MSIENLLFEVSDALRWPVMVGVLLALAWSLIEIGILFGELWRRRKRSVENLERYVDAAEVELAHHDPYQAMLLLSTVSWNQPMRDAMESVVAMRDLPDAENRISKRLADYDYRCMRRLERTRILVRMGPALGLMGTLIPLSPALGGLAEGNVTELTDNLRVAFGVTVAGLLTGGLAFGVSLVRDRLYAQDYSDVEFTAATLSPEKNLDHHLVPAATQHAGSTSVSMGNP